MFNVDGEYFALANRCPHEGGALCQGKIVALVQSDGPGNYRLTRHRRIPALPLARLGVRHPHRPVLVRSEVDPSPAVPGHGRAGETLVKGPYVAETFPVSVEEDYLVVET